MNRENTVLQWLLYHFLLNRNLSTRHDCCAGVACFCFLSTLLVLACGGDGLSAAVQWFPSVPCKRQTAEEGFTEVALNKALVGVEVRAPHVLVIWLRT